ncbi:Calx-beta domain-containing protein [Falsiroseomonas sp.]|uniref:Calx-beta domain-containing protein n=1 Tax=Falsiroseomonas sp. TaxID=2870721 RepID=UPI003F727C9C
MAYPIVSVGSQFLDIEEGESGSRFLTFTVLLSAVATEEVTIAYATANLGATAGVDYEAQSGVLRFAPGETSRTVAIRILGDTAYEADENFSFTLRQPGGPAALSTTANFAIGTILNEDAPPLPTVAFDGAWPEILEGDAGRSLVGFTVRLSAAATSPVTVAYSTADGGALAGADYEAQSGRLVFAVGETAKTIFVAVLGDRVYEPNESFFLRLDGVTGGAVLANRGTVSIPTILNDDAPLLPIVTLTPAYPEVVEGDAGQMGLIFTVRLSAAATQPVRVTYSTADAGATAGLDYLASSGTLAFAIGETEKTFSLAILGDLIYEADESFFVQLDSVQGGAVLANAGTATVATIMDDDLPGRTNLSVIPQLTEMAEGNGAGVSVLTYLVTRSGDLSGTSTVDWAVRGSGARPADAADFWGGLLPSGRLSFAAGEAEKLVKVRVQRDALPEADEGFTLSLSRPIGAGIASGQAGGVIRNDDAPRGTLAIAGEITDRDEGTGDGVSVFTYRLTRTGDLSETMQAAWSVAGAGLDPAEAADFLGGVWPGGVVTFAAGEAEQTIKVRVLREAAQEGDESFVVTLAPPAVPGIRVVNGVAGGIIRDDDTPRVSFALTTDVVDRTEGTGAGVSVFSYTIIRSGDLSGTSHLDWVVEGHPLADTADAADFLGGVLPGGRVTFAAGEAEQVIKVRVLRDAEVEPDSYFRLLAKEAGSPFAHSLSALGVIRDDDAPRGSLSLTAEVADRSEGNGSGVSVFSYTVTRGGDLAGAAQVGWSVRGHGTAAADAADFLGGVVPGGSIGFAAGQAEQLIKIRVLRDAAHEADEGFAVTLQSPSAGLAILEGTAFGTIRNDDPAPSLATLSDHMLIA